MQHVHTAPASCEAKFWGSNKVKHKLCQILGSRYRIDLLFHRARCSMRPAACSGCYTGPFAPGASPFDRPLGIFQVRASCSSFGIEASLTGGTEMYICE